MNCTIYIFGSLGGGYVQFPKDYTKSIFQNFYSRATADSLIAIHRKNQLMYYGYIRKLDESSQYIGFCVLINGAMFTDISKLFSVFENAFSALVFKGSILSINNKGDISSEAYTLADKEDDIKEIAALIKNGLEDSEPHMEPLPPVDLSVANTDYKTFDLNDDNALFIRASVKFSYTYITKRRKCDTTSLSKYKEIIRSLNAKTDKAESKYKTLKSQYDKLNRQKKQYRNVIIVCLLVVMYFLVASLMETKGVLKNTRDEVSRKENALTSSNATVNKLRNSNNNLLFSINNERGKRIAAENKLNSITQTYSSLQPLFIKNISFDYSSGWLYFDYYGICNKTITLVVKTHEGLYTYSNSKVLTIKPGFNSEYIFVNGSLDSSQQHSFELLIGNKIIGGGQG